jgi:enoyl-CoA hydratase
VAGCVSTPGDEDLPPIAEDRPGGLRVIQLNRPGYANALSAQLVEAMHDELDRAEQDLVRVLAWRGNPRHFCAGFDLRGLRSQTDADLFLRFVRVGLLLERITTAPFATIAVVEGAAVGAGADLAAACDHRLGTHGASFRFPGSAFGLVLGVERLSRVVGQAKAASLAGSGRTVSASDAHRSGLLTALVEPNEVETLLAELTADMAGPPVAALPALLAATRPPAGDSALAALARSAAHPGLHDRVMAYASRPRQD